MENCERRTSRSPNRPRRCRSWCRASKIGTGVFDLLVNETRGFRDGVQAELERWPLRGGRLRSQLTARFGQQPAQVPAWHGASSGCQRILDESLERARRGVRGRGQSDGLPSPRTTASRSRSPAIHDLVATAPAASSRTRRAAPRATPSRCCCRPTCATPARCCADPRHADRGRRAPLGQRARRHAGRGPCWSAERRRVCLAALLRAATGGAAQT